MHVEPRVQPGEKRCEPSVSDLFSTSPSQIRGKLQGGSKKWRLGFAERGEKLLHSLLGLRKNRGINSFMGGDSKRGGLSGSTHSQMLRHRIVASEKTKGKKRE